MRSAVASPLRFDSRDVGRILTELPQGVQPGNQIQILHVVNRYSLKNHAKKILDLLVSTGTGIPKRHSFTTSATMMSKRVARLSKA